MAFCPKREARGGHVSLSRKMPRSPRLAHKVPVMQASANPGFLRLTNWP